MNTKPKAVIITTIVAALAIAGAFAIYPALVTSASATGASNNPKPTTANSGTTPSAIFPRENSSMPPGSQGKGSQGNWGPGGFQSGSGGRGRPGQFSGPGSKQASVNFTIGEEVTITNMQGEYSLVTNHTVNGTASGTLNLTVTNKFAGGYTLSLTSGNMTVDGTAYTVSSGSVQMDQFGNSLSGQGTTTPSGQFLIQSQAHGSFAGSSASVFLDFEDGSAEYEVVLTGNVVS